MAFVALQFEDDQILVASARLAGKQLEVSHLFSVPLTGEDDEAGESLKDQLTTHGLTRSDTIVVVSRANAEMREIVVPPAPSNELPDMVRLIARSEFASLNENWSLDFIPLSDEETIQRTVLAMGISPDLQTQINSVTEPSGLKIKHIVLRPYSTIDLVKAKIRDDQVRLIVDPNGDTTDMTVVEGAKLLATRTVRIPGSYDSNRRSESLLSEIRRTLASSRKVLGEKKVSSILMFGEEKENKPLAGNLKSHLELEIEFLNPMTGARKTSSLQEPEQIERYAALLGSLKQQGSVESHAIDFINPRKTVVVKPDYSRWYLHGGLALAAVLLAMLTCWWVLSGQAKENRKLSEQVTQLRNKNDGVDGSPKVDQVLGEIEQIDRWVQNEVNWLEELYQYSERALTPNDSIVDNFDAEASTRSSNPPRVVVKTRFSNVETESKLIESLNERPFVVSSTRIGYAEGVKDYPNESTFNVRLVVDDSERLKQIDSMALEFIKARNAKLMNSGSAASDPFGEDPTAVPNP